MSKKRKAPHYMTVLAHGVKALNRIDPEDPITIRDLVTVEYVKTFVRGSTRTVMLNASNWYGYYDPQNRFRFREVLT